jgi:manganese/zinc/iron transport system permease protein
MNELIPAFDWQTVFVSPWTEGFSSTIWVVLMGAMVAIACGLVGNYLILRRMALVGDAISHSVLPGLAIAFLLTGSRGSGVMFFGALIAGIATTLLIEVIHKKSRVKQDAAIGIAFTSLFALGVILITVYAASGKVDLDQECVLYGEIGLVWLEDHTVVAGATLGPESVVRMTIIAAMTVLLVGLFYKELLVSSFDPGLASSLGINATLVHYLLMSWLSVVVVSAFESVGAILVIAMLILPGATASLLSYRLPRIMALTVIHAIISSAGGLHLALWLGCSTAGAMVVVGSILFMLAWIFSPSQGLLRRWFVKVEDAPEDATISTKPLPAAR